MTGGLLAASIFAARNVDAQQVDIGHKQLGTLGLQAGTQQETGLYVATRSLWYSANTVVDRYGNALPVGLDLDGLGTGLGLGATFEVREISTYVGVGVGISAAHVTAHTERPEASIDRAGLGDLSVQPIRLGWRTPHLDLVTSYAFYAPTGRFAPGGNDGVGRGQWTHQLSLGGTVYFDDDKTWYVSALASVDLNSRKRGLDLTRGSTVQIQGGAGKRLFQVLDVGIASYALWQVSDDSGADLPPVLRGARDRTYGLGPEIDLLIPAIRGRLTFRYEHDFASESRPQGQLFLFGLTVAAWKPPRR